MHHFILVSFHSSTILVSKTLLFGVTYNTSKNLECIEDNFKFDWLQELESGARRSARLFNVLSIERSNGSSEVG